MLGGGGFQPDKAMLYLGKMFVITAVGIIGVGLKNQYDQLVIHYKRDMPEFEAFLEASKPVPWKNHGNSSNDNEEIKTEKS